jgi:hypothetical protein
MSLRSRRCRIWNSIDEGVDCLEFATALPFDFLLVDERFPIVQCCFVRRLDTEASAIIFRVDHIPSLHRFEWPIDLLIRENAPGVTDDSDSQLRSIGVDPIRYQKINTVTPDVAPGGIE